MIDVKGKDIPEIKNMISGGRNVLYGAGNTGKKVCEILKDYGIDILAFLDDDVLKHGNKIFGKPVISREKLSDVIQQAGEINVILSSIYTAASEAKLKEFLPKVHLYNAYPLYLEYAGKEDYADLLSLLQSRDEWMDKMGNLSKIFNDEKSLKIVSAVECTAHTYWNEGIVDIQWLQKTESQEEHYFIKEVQSALGQDSIIVDCGAFTGDMLGQLSCLQIPYKTLYAFEANPDVYSILLDNIHKNNLENKVKSFMSGVWSEAGVQYFQSASPLATSGKIVSGEVDRLQKINVDKLDNIINEKIDLLKMDIEGAELPALKGAETLMLTSRPILAISVYHSLDDFVDIPLYLQALLADYSFFLKHHSSGIGETVLYGIPKERGI